MFTLQSGELLQLTTGSALSLDYVFEFDDAKIFQNNQTTASTFDIAKGHRSLKRMALTNLGVSSQTVTLKKSVQGNRVYQLTPAVVIPAGYLLAYDQLWGLRLIDTAAQTGSILSTHLGTPASGTLTNCTGLPIVAGTTGTLSVARGGTGGTDIFPGFMIPNHTDGGNPSNSTSYFMGPIQNQTWAAINAWLDVRAWIAPLKLRVKAVTVCLQPFGTNGSGETSSIVIRVNNTTDTPVFTSNITVNAGSGVANNFTATGLSLTINQGDRFCLKWTTPAWATPPTTLYSSMMIYAEPVT